MPNDKMTVQASNELRTRDSPSMVPAGRRSSNLSGQEQKDVLGEARAILQEPSRNTKRKILVSINLVIGIIFGVYGMIQLITTGHLPDPERDKFLLPALMIIMIGSAVYNISMLVKQSE